LIREYTSLTTAVGVRVPLRYFDESDRKSKLYDKGITLPQQRPAELWFTLVYFDVARLENCFILEKIQFCFNEDKNFQLI
jgi:hypothetical protein